MKKILSILFSLILLCACNVAIDDNKTNDITNNINTETSSETNTTTVVNTSTDISLSGEVNEAIVINGNDNVNITLDNVTYTGSVSFIDVESAASVTINVVGINNITVTGDNHGIVSKDDLVIEGNGELNITSNKDGIHVNDSLKVYNVAINITASSDGFDVNNNTTIDNATISITCGKDGLSLGESDNTAKHNGDLTITNSTLTLNVDDDGIDGLGDVIIENTTVDIISGGGYENAATHYSDMMFGGMGGWHGNQTPNNSGEINYDTDDDDSATKSKGIISNNLATSNSTFNINSQDDGFNAEGDITIESGTFYIKAGDDGIHADGTVTINGGTFDIYAWEAIEGNYIYLNDGIYTIYALDDGINSSKLMEINGGDYTIDMAQGDTDALDSNGDLYINGGTLNITAQSPFDYDGNGAINGGTVYVNGSQVTEIYSQFFGGGNQGGFGNQQGGFPGGSGDSSNGFSGGQQGGFPGGPRR